LDFSRPGKPTGNGFIKAFNSKLRAECLNASWFMDFADAREKLDAWRRDNNEIRPHSAIGYNVPLALHYPDGVTSPPSGKSRKIPAPGAPGLGSRAKPISHPRSSPVWPFEPARTTSSTSG
jgi:hypothetical protein